MLLREFLPSGILSDYIRLYRIIDFEFADNIAIPIKVYPPRPEHCLQFFPTSTEITYPGSTQLIRPNNASFIGQHTIINNRTIFKKFLSLQVVFQGGCMAKLFNCPANLFTNQFIDADNIVGDDAALVNEQLYHAGNYKEMIQIVEYFLLGKIRKIKSPAVLPIDMIVKRMISDGDKYSLDWFARESCLSYRQFDRNFNEKIGIGPKEYLRIIRFDKAFRMKNKYPAKEWLSIAINCGYYDYQHLAKDYKAFTGYTPQQFYELDNRSPERIFGEAEV